MISRFLYFLTQPPRYLMSQVMAYYALLALATWGLMAIGPDWLDFDAWRPRGALFDFSGRVDVFEPVGDGQEPDDFTVRIVPLCMSLIGACALMIPISWTYMGTRKKSGFDQSVVQTMIILPVAVAGVVTIVHDSVALAFSLAGIVAAVRFRNTLKDTSDALYIFAAIAVGLANGVGEIGVAAVVSVFLNLAVLTLWRCDYGTCPVGGPKDEFSSGLLLESVGAPPPLAAAAGANGKKKKKRKKKGRRGDGPQEPAVSLGVDGAAGPASVPSPAGQVSQRGEDPPR